MSYQLVIAEKPSVARSIAGVIGADKKQDGYMEGNGYLVSWCIGHLVSLADAGTYDERFKKWRYDDLPILPQEWQYIIPDDKKKQFDTLRSLMERPDVTGLVCATDAGREGELIFRFVYQMAGCKKPFQRLWISSMEDAAIKDGFAQSAVMDGKVPKLLSRDFSASARIAVHLKDINNAMDVAAHLGVELPMTEIVKEQMDWMDARGMIDEDQCALAKYYEDAMGVEIK